MGENFGKVLMYVGIGVFVIGLLYYFFSDKFSWWGNLPGDLNFTKGKVKVYFPVTSMVLTSILMNLLYYFYRKY